MSGSFYLGVYAEEKKERNNDHLNEYITIYVETGFYLRHLILTPHTDGGVFRETRHNSSLVSMSSSLGPSSDSFSITMTRSRTHTHGQQDNLRSQ